MKELRIDQVVSACVVATNEEAPESHLSKPLVSVVIPSKNASRFIADTLRSLMAQTFTNFEIIVVDSFSTDGTDAIVASFPRVRLLKSGGERSRQTNEGFRVAKGKYLWRTDADNLFDSNLLSQAVAKIESGYDALTIPGTSDERAGLWAKVHRRERESLIGERLRTGPSFYRASVVTRLGGFNEQLFAFEDHDFHNRIRAAGLRVGTISAKTYHLGEPTSLRDVVRKYLYYGDRNNIIEFARQNPGRGLWQIAPIRLVYLRRVGTIGLYFYPFLIFHLVRYASALIGFATSGKRRRPPA